jgi:predicted lipoprotein with Yx(FWY)xxD motif
VVEGCESSDFTTIKRIDGRQQTTYKGMPLYYFKNDKYPGDTFGHGIGDVWFWVTP